MSKFLDELFDNHESENDLDAEVETEIEEELDQVEETTEEEDGETEEVVEVDTTEEASEEVEAEDDDDTELTPAEKKAYGRLKALQDEREKRRSADEARKAAEAERDQLNAQLAEMQRQQAQRAAQNLPDPIHDPEGYIAAREAQIEEQMVRHKLGTSLTASVSKYGEDEVTAAATWFQEQMEANPHMPLRQNMLSQADPMEYVVSTYKQTQKIQALTSGDYSSLIEDLKKAGYEISKANEPTSVAQATQVTATAAKAAPAKKVSAPKRSALASTTSPTLAESKEVSMMDTILRRK